MCEVFARLAPANRTEVSVKGRVFFGPNLVVLGESGCEDQHGRLIAPSALRVDLESGRSQKQLQELRAKVDAIRAKGRYPLVTGEAKGYIVIEQSRNSLFPAVVKAERIAGLRIEELPGAAELPVVPVCEVLNNPARFDGQRIAIEAVAVSDSLNGTWLTGSCGPPKVHPSIVQRTLPAYLIRGLDTAFQVSPTTRAPGQSMQRIVLAGWLYAKHGYEARCSGDLIVRGTGYGPLGLAALRFEAEEVLRASPVPAGAAAFENEPQRCPVAP